MRFQRLLAAAVVVGLVGLTNVSTAEAGLFGNYSYGSSSCCDSSVAWGGCETTGCDACCTSSYGGRRRLFSGLFRSSSRSSCGCEPEPLCSCAVEPTCGCEVVEPVYEYVEEPICGCGKRKFGGFLKNLFKCPWSSSCCDDPSCGVEPTCGCAPTCGCR